MYEEVGTFRRGESATSTLLPEFAIAVAHVFHANGLAPMGMRPKAELTPIS
jgi:hypothetical protein